MKLIVGAFLKLLPIAAVLALCYVLFVSPDTNLSEGVKLSVSALLGAIASYIFVAYAQFIEKVEARKAKHRNALADLEFKFNEQLSWLSDVIFHLSGHEALLKVVIGGKALMAHDASSHREPISIESEIHDLASVSYKNELLRLITLYRKLQNDLTSHRQAYAFMLNSALDNGENVESYRRGLPSHLERTQLIRKFAMAAVEQTKLALSRCRVLSTNHGSMMASLARFLIQQPDPKNYEALVLKEREALEAEIARIMEQSQKEIEDVEKT